MTNLLLVGATGLVGQAVLRLALAEPRIERVVAPTRRALPPHPRLHNPQIDFGRLPLSAPWWSVDAAISTLGTTMAQAGSREAFRRVDLDYPVAVARRLREGGCKVFALTSAAGADARSRWFYLRTKGELESALARLGFDSLSVLRPSLIGGRREHGRPLESLAQVAAAALRPLLPPRYRMVPAERIAARLLRAVLEAPAGTQIIASAAI